MNHFIKNKKGGTLVLAAMSIVVLLAMAGMAIDVTHLYNVKNQLQQAADAAALAGANQLYGNDVTMMEQNAISAAITVASNNVADVDENGNPRSVALHNEDITFGSWNNGWNDTAILPNAVKVVAKRTGGADQPMVMNWFIKVLALMGYDSFDASAVSATAIACRPKMGILPIAVNEYWDEAPKKAPGSPYGQVYPDSFMRETNVDGTPSTMVGKTFAILGSDANCVQSDPKQGNYGGTSNSINGYIDLMFRSDRHDGLIVNGAHWYSVGTNWDGDCSSCNSTMTSLTDAPASGDIDNQKWRDMFTALFFGIPDGIIPPIPVQEFPSAAYPASSYNSTNGNDPSNCPYATIPTFSSSGNPLQKPYPLGPTNLSFNEKWPVGSQFIVAVYDGTHTGDASVPNLVTVVGYGIIQIDGYGENVSRLGTSGNTAYGHAVKHGIAGERDEYLIQPDSPSPNCSDFMPKLDKLRKKFAPVVLVDPSLQYGVASH